MQCFFFFTVIWMHDKRSTTRLVSLSLPSDFVCNRFKQFFVCFFFCLSWKGRVKTWISNWGFLSVVYISLANIEIVVTLLGSFSDSSTIFIIHFHSIWVYVSNADKIHENLQAERRRQERKNSINRNVMLIAIDSLRTRRRSTKNCNRSSTFLWLQIRRLCRGGFAWALNKRKEDTEKEKKNSLSSVDKTIIEIGGANRFDENFCQLASILFACFVNATVAVTTSTQSRNSRVPRPKPIAIITFINLIFKCFRI